MGLAMSSIVLLVVSALCQALLGYFGYRVSARPLQTNRAKVAHERAFIVVAAIGCGAVVFAGFQSSKEQAAALRTQAAALTEMKRGQKSGFSALQSEIRSLPSPPTPQVTVYPNPVPKPPTQHADIRITRFDYGHASEDTDQTHFAVNVNLKNVGEIAGDSPARTTQVWIMPRELTPSEVDGQMSKVLKAALETPPVWDNERSQIDAGDANRWYSVYISPDKENADLLNSGKGWMYLFSVLTYRDKNTVGHHFMVTEYCAGLMPDKTLMECGEHNRTSMH